MLILWFLVFLNYTHVFPQLVNALSTTQDLSPITTSNCSARDLATVSIAIYLTNKVTNFIMKVTFDDRVLL